MRPANVRWFSIIVLYNHFRQVEVLGFEEISEVYYHHYTNIFYLGDPTPVIFQCDCEMHYTAAVTFLSVM